MKHAQFQRPLIAHGLSEKTITLVGIYFINNFRGRTYFNGRLDLQGDDDQFFAGQIR